MLSNDIRPSFYSISEACDVLQRQIARIYHFLRTKALPSCQQQCDLTKPDPGGRGPEDNFGFNETYSHDERNAILEELQLNVQVLASWQAKFEDFFKQHGYTNQLSRAQDTRNSSSE